MDDVAAGEVEHAVLAEPAAAPDEEGVDRVDEARPQDHEGDPGLEVDAAEHRAEHQDRRDRREHELEVDERRLRELQLADQRDVRLSLQVVGAEDGARLSDQIVEEAVRTTDADMNGMPEAHVEAVEHPENEDEGERDEGQHHAVDRPALLHHAAVQDDEAWHAHQAYERGSGELPRVVARAQPCGVQHEPLLSSGTMKKAAPRYGSGFIACRAGFIARPKWR